jgi:DNA-binding transcriptional ArsR family regulator
MILECGDVMSQQATATKARFFMAFAHPIRLQILEELKDGERCVYELVQSVKSASQSQVSNHLACLDDCGLVSSRREWRKIYYRLADPKIARFLKIADEIAPQVASRIAVCPDITPNTGQERR